MEPPPSFNLRNSHTATHPGIWSNLRGPNFVEFRCELFNALNHPNFFLPGGDLSNSKTFEIINQAFPARSVQFAGKFYFRAAREQADIAEPRA